MPTKKDVTNQYSLEILNADEVVLALRQLGLNASAVLEVAVQAGADVIKEAADGFAPGPNNATETKKRTDDFVQIIIGPDEEHWYYRFFETGTDPHEVLPKDAQALRIEDGFFARANVSGMPAEPFLRPAIDTGKADATDAIGDKFRDTLT